MHQLPSIAWPGPQGVLFFPVAAYFGIPDRINSAFLHFLYQHSYLPNIWIDTWQPDLHTANVAAIQLAQYHHLQLKRYYNLFAFYGHAICHGQLMYYGPIFYVFCHIHFFVLPILYDIHLELLQVHIPGCCFLYILYCIVMTVLTFMLRPHISLSLFSSWFWHDNQSAINSSRSDLYSMHTLYWCIFRIMHWRHCDSVATSLPIIITNSF